MICAIAANLVFILFMPMEQLWIVFLYLCLLGFSYAFFITPNNNLVMSLVDPSRQAISSSVFKLATCLGQIVGILLMEIMFTIPFQALIHNNTAQLKNLPPEVLISGFRWSYAGGLLLCAIALVLTILVKEGKPTGANSGERFVDL